MLVLTTLTLAAALAACTAEAPQETGDATPAADTTAPEAPAPAGDRPAGEVAPETREPADAAPAEAPAEAGLPEGVDAKWALYYEHGIRYEFGSEAGLAKAAETGKPMMMFYTATW
jgi:hypothetical protein